MSKDEKNENKKNSERDDVFHIDKGALSNQRASYAAKRGTANLNTGESRVKSAKMFLGELLEKKEPNLGDIDYDEVKVTGLLSVGRHQFHLLKDGKVVKSTKYMRLEGAEDPTTRDAPGYEGVRHFFYQLMRHKRSEFLGRQYEEFTVSNINGKGDYLVSVVESGKEIGKVTVPKDLDTKSQIDYTKDPSYSDPWEE